MIKNKLIAAVLCTAVCAGSAMAMEVDPKIYVGAQLAGSNLTLKSAGWNRVVNDQNVTIVANGGSFSLTNNTGGAGLFVGSRLTENFGVELGYIGLGKTTINVPGDTFSMKHGNTYIDAIGYLPIDSNLDLTGSIGFGEVSTKLSHDIYDNQGFSATRGTHNKVSPRLGVGVEYRFHENVGMRFNVHYQEGNQIIKKVTTSSLGLFYRF